MKIIKFAYSTDYYFIIFANNWIMKVPKSYCYDDLMNEPRCLP